MSFRPRILQSLRNRAQALGRVLLPALAVALLCPAGVVCADTSAAAQVAEGALPHEHKPEHEHEHGGSSSDHSDDSCPHCPTHASAQSATRAACDVAARDAPPPAKLPHDVQLFALPAGIPSIAAILHPSPPRTAFSTGAGPPAIPLNLLHCILLI